MVKEHIERINMPELIFTLVDRDEVHCSYDLIDWQASIVAWRDILDGGVCWGKNFWGKRLGSDLMASNIPVPRSGPLNTPEWATLVVFFPQRQRVEA